jgi:tetratricopeptide (TPR) repeat protein
MSLLAKPMAVTLPAMLLVLDGYPLRRIDYPNLGSWRSWLNLWPLIREKLLWIAIVAAFCAATLIAQKEGGAVVQLEYLPLESRIENAVYSYVRYLLYLVIPLNLGLMYYYRPGTVEFLMAAFVLAGICILFLRRWRTIPALATGWALYLGTLVPVIGIVQVGSQSMADRYMYVPMIGLLISLIPVFEAIQRRIGRGATVGGATMVLVFSLLAWFQTSLWKDSALIFEHTIRHSGPHPAMLNNLSVHFLKNGRPEISLFHLNRLLENHRDFGPAYANLGIALVSLQREAEGVEMLRIAVELEPDRPRVKLSYALALIRAGQVERAMELLRTTKEEFGPNERYNLSMVHYYLGLGYDALGDLDKALAEYQISLRLMQRHPELLNDLGTLLLRLNRPREALRMTQRSVILNPNAPEPLFNLAGLYKHLGNSELAETTYQETIRRFPRFHPARTALAALYLDQNLPDQALATIQPIRSHTNYLVRREVALLTLHANRLVNHTTSAEEIEDFKTRFPEETHLLERLQEHWTRMGM